MASDDKIKQRQIEHEAKRTERSAGRGEFGTPATTPVSPDASQSTLAQHGQFDTYMQDALGFVVEFLRDQNPDWDYVYSNSETPITPDTPLDTILDVAAGGGGGPAPDIYVKVSAADTTTGYLNSKVSAGTGISTAILNPAGNEQLQINCTIMGYIPVGGIIDYYAANLLSLPANFHECDGTFGTPDLRGLYTKGTTALEPTGTTGGSATHTPAGSVAAPVFTGNAMGNHSHTTSSTTSSDSAGTPSGTVSQPTFTGDALPNHNHSFSGTTGAPSSTILVNDLGMAGAATDAHTHDISGTTGDNSAGTPSGTVSQPTFTGNALGTHSHTATGTAANASAGTPSGTNSAPAFTGTPANTEPPYMTLYKVMRIS